MSSLSHFLTSQFLPLSASEVQAHYSSFSSSRHSNPAAFDAHVAWWARLVCRAARAGVLNGNGGRRLVWNVQEAEEMRWEEESVGRPMGLAEVLVSCCSITHTQGQERARKRERERERERLGYAGISLSRGGGRGGA
jgi:hypothetical protein